MAGAAMQKYSMARGEILGEYDKSCYMVEKIV